MSHTSVILRFVRLAIAAVTVTIAATTSVIAQPGATYEIVSSFTISFDAGNAPSSLRQDSDGSFYGTTTSGGTFDAGVLFRMDTTGAVTALHHFSGAADGGAPSGLVRASDGRFYGVTRSGALTVFRFTPGGALTTLQTFSSAEAAPVDLFAASDGNVYGLLERGGDFGNGAIFVIDAGGVTTVHNVPLSAGRSMSSLVKGSDGRFYVTAEAGGASDSGTLFAIDDAGTVTIIHSFGGAAPGDGRSPSGLIQGRDGRLYGTTRTTVSGPGSVVATVYAVDLAGNYQSLASFPSNVQPARRLDLLEASDGNLYGVTSPADNPMGSNSVFRLDSSGTLTTVGSGFFSLGQLTQGADARLYVPVAGGNIDGGGSILAMDLAGTQLTTLYEFTVGSGVAGAGRPNGVIQTRDGQFYGTTSGFPHALQNPTRQRTGTLFAMDAAGARTTLHTFLIDFPSTFGIPTGNLLEGADGSVSGVTFSIADAGIPPGEIFRFTPRGLFSTLQRVGGLAAGLIHARDGRLYGVIGDPTSFASGGVFRIESNGTVTFLHGFTATDNTAYPVGELVEIDDGSLYGATRGGFVPSAQRPGAIFQIDPATEAFAIRYRFTDGTKPAGRLIQGTDGLIYGTTENGGAFGWGTVFSLDAAGTLNTLHHFAGGDGANPSAGVIQGLDGRLYGTTRDGGAFGYGTVFALNVTGGLTTLHDFTLSDGANPVEELIQGNDGAFYGTARSGGPQGGGVVFRIRPGTTPSDQYARDRVAQQRQVPRRLRRIN